MLLPLRKRVDSGEAKVSYLRAATGLLLVGAGAVIGAGGFIIDAVRGSVSTQHRTQEANTKIAKAIGILSGVGAANADVPFSCSSCSSPTPVGGGCGGCGCGE